MMVDNKFTIISTSTEGQSPMRTCRTTLLCSNSRLFHFWQPRLNPLNSRRKFYRVQPVSTENAGTSNFWLFPKAAGARAHAIPTVQTVSKFTPDCRRGCVACESCSFLCELTQRMLFCDLVESLLFRRKKER